MVDLGSCILKRNLALLGNGFDFSQRNKRLYGQQSLEANGLGKDGWNSPYLLLSTHQSPGKGISQISPLFQLFIKYSLGIVLQSDFGLIVGLLLCLSVLFFLPSTTFLWKLSVVSNFYLSSDWNLHLRRNIINDKVPQLGSHLSILTHLHLSLSCLDSFPFSFRLQALVPGSLGFFLGLLFPCRPILPIPFTFPFQNNTVFPNSLKNQGFL